jgi:hypothetical protein
MQHGKRMSNLLDIPAVFSGLLTVIIIGLIVENLISRHRAQYGAKMGHPVLSRGMTSP